MVTLCVQGDQSLDPPQDTFRIRLVCPTDLHFMTDLLTNSLAQVYTLLETCGEYFEGGSSRKRLDRFLLYFQQYLFTKDTLTVSVEFIVKDLFEKLRCCFRVSAES